AICVAGTAVHSGREAHVFGALLQRIRGGAPPLGEDGERRTAEREDCRAFRARLCLSGVDEARPGLCDGNNLARGDRSNGCRGKARTAAAAVAKEKVAKGLARRSST